MFLATPANGLQDIYGYFKVMIPAVEVPLQFVYHKYDADYGSGDYGQEYDVVASAQVRQVLDRARQICLLQRSGRTRRLHRQQVLGAG